MAVVANQFRFAILFGVLVTALLGATTRMLEEETVIVTDTQAVQGGVAKMTCDISPPLQNDMVSLVIWYKDGVSTPIYSFDVRGKGLDQAKHWAAEQTLGGRAYFRHSETPAKLTVENVRDSDGGTYRCRVDFKKSPTRNSKVNLSIIIPPEKLVILDEKGANIPHYILGPYNEGSNVDITCIATGGRPSPRVTWWQDNALLDDSWEALPGRRVRNTLHLEKLSRRQLHAVLTCQAASSPLAAPLSGAVTLDLNLRPLWVQLIGQRRPLSADNTYEVTCEVVGTRPPPVISWWKSGVPLRNTRETTSSDGNTTTSTLTFVPAMEDSGKMLTCRAGTPLIADSTLEDSWRLDIYHVPIVTLELGSNLNASHIKEGSDVYFECNIKSNPWVYRISWRHNGQPLYNNASAGTIVSNQSLVLQAVTRAREGFYTCVGSNQEGDGESNPVHLDVKFAPVCAYGQQLMYGVARQEPARVSCDVEANPGESLTFSWRFNNSAETVDLPAALVSVDRTRSVAVYTPATELDYGSLLCWARNELGEQRQPCVFHVFPAGRPDAPNNCSIVNQTADALHVECSEGFDGGLPQEFVMEVYDAATQALVGNVTSRTPVFTVSGLQAGLGFDISLLATNSKGRSRPVPLHAYTLQPAERRSAATTHILHITPILGILIGVVSALVLVAVIIVIVMRVRGHSGDSEKEDDDDFGLKTRNGIKIKQASDNASNADHLSKDTEDSAADSKDDVNPDIIPHNSEKESLDEDEKAFESIREQTRQIYENKIPRLYSPQFRNLANLSSSNNGGEVTYAELALTRQPGVGAASSPEGGVKLVHSAATLLRRPPQEPTVYAQIDVTRRSTASGLPPKQEFSLRPPQQPPPPHSLVYMPPTPSPLRSVLPQEDDHLHDAYISAATPLISQQQHADNKVLLQAVSDKGRGGVMKTPRVSATRF